MGKKNLEQLFKDTFGSFQETPDSKVWDKIESSLNRKKKKRRAVVLWWQLGGIAATLAIVLLAFNPFSSSLDNTPTISDIEETSTPIIKEDSDVRDAEIVDSNNESVSNIVTQSSKTEVVQTTTAQNKETKTDNQNSTKPGQKDVLENETAIVSNEAAASKSESNALPAEKQQDASILKQSAAIASNGTTEEKSIPDLKERDSEKEVEAEKQSIFDAIKEQEEEAIAENNAGKWSVGPSVAPVYFNGSGSGSPIHSDFESNSKSGNFNMSYGVGVAYEVNKRLKIRSGVHKVNFGYDTDDVLFTSTLRTSSNEKISNISYTENAENIIVQSKNSGKSISNVSAKEVALNSSPAFDGKMVQQLGYIEVPLELNYAIVDKKFGVDVIGGVSSLFLIDNSVLLESNALITEVGEANNVNSLNFSANFGMGINYDFTPKFQLNIEPVFKYQLNTFSNTSGTFRPYSVGIYSGVSFKF